MGFTGITIVNYGMGNIRSVQNALDFLKQPSRVSSDQAEIAASEKLIIPGVGSFRAAMDNIRSLGLIEPLQRAVRDRKVPVLGICLGMQLLAEHGVEGGGSEGLGWIPGTIQPFKFSDPGVKIPHMGFNVTRPNPANAASALLFGGSGNEAARPADFYYVHSFHFVCKDEQDVCASCDYHGDFTAVVARENVYGTQFHPEKSQTNGLVLLRNFAERTRAVAARA